MNEISLVTGQQDYDLPVDFDKHLTETFWDYAQREIMIGPLSAKDWQAIKYGSWTSIGVKRYQIAGWNDKKIMIDSLPTSTESGNIVAFRYQSKMWFRPRSWVTSTFFGAGSYCWYNGKWFRTVLGGVSGATPPTATMSDGAVLWELQTTPYTEFMADTDEFILSEDLVCLGVQWEWRSRHDMPYQELKAQYELEKENALSKIRGLKKIYVDKSTIYNRRNANIPEII